MSQVPSRWTALKGLARRPIFLVPLLATLLIIGFVLVALANVTAVESTEERSLQGVAAPFSLEPVTEAVYEGFGFAQANALQVECGVSFRFLTDLQLQQYEQSGVLPQPQLHCQGVSATLPGSIAAVLVENQRINASLWDIQLVLVHVSRPYALIALPAIAFLLAGGLGFAAYALQWALIRWMEGFDKE